MDSKDVIKFQRLLTHESTMPLAGIPHIIYKHTLTTVIPEKLTLVARHRCQTDAFTMS